VSSDLTVSILILTLNEERNLAECLGTVAWADDIVVLDSYSTDETKQIAEEHGARVVQRRFDNWAAHQNWAVEHIPFKHRWVFYLDADERMTPELRDEICTIAGDAHNDKVAYYCGRKNYFLGKWIRHAMPPGMIMRFFVPAHIRFERLVNPTPVIQGNHGFLTKHFLHYNFSKGITEWLDKHNKYSSYEALEGVKLLAGEVHEQASVFCRDPALRRKALKNWAFRFPFRPLLKFCYLYFLRLGLLDGRAGFIYCRLQAMYEYMIVLKMLEHERVRKGLPV
jgi:glycosyltransferase involved in cell wall biosynthesis